MPRRARSIVGGYVYHILNRSNARLPLFQKEADYEAFLRVLEQAHRRLPLRILAYCVMPNHWHFLVWPEVNRGRDVSEFFRWLTVTHTQRWHSHYGTAGSGHLYQGRFKSFPVEADDHFLAVARYVERNALRAGLTDRAENWRFGSLWQHVGQASCLPARPVEQSYHLPSPLAGQASRLPVPLLPTHEGTNPRPLLAEWPVARPTLWRKHVNEPQTEAELAAIRRSIQRSRPFGSIAWTEQKVRELGLEWTVRARGRPKKEASA